MSRLIVLLMLSCSFASHADKHLENMHLPLPALDRDDSVSFNIKQYDYSYMKYTRLNPWLNQIGLSSFHQASKTKIIKARETKESDSQRAPKAWVQYQYGKQTEETGVFSELSSELNGQNYFLQGSITLYSQDKFNILVNAKYEQKDNDLITLTQEVRSANPDEITRIRNTSLGVIGRYSITSNWTVSGMLTSTAYLNDRLPYSPLNSQYSNMALIGTSYSF